MSDPAPVSAGMFRILAVGLSGLGLQVPLVFTWVALGGGLDKTPEWVNQHRGLAVIILVAYELGVVVWGVARQVWKRLEPDVITGLEHWVRVIFSAAREGLSTLLSRFRRRYLQQVIYEHRDLNVRGLQEQGAYTLEVEHVFVELRISSNHPSRVNRDPLAKQILSESQPIWGFIRYMTRREGVGLAVLGAPGSGKTTLLQSIALTFAKNKQRKHKLRSYLPLMLFLRSHAEKIQTEKPSLGKLAQDYFEERFSAIEGMPAPPKDWFGRQLVKGACIVLLDGLDEIADKKLRKSVSAWVDEQIRNYPYTPFVITARPGGYNEAPLSKVDVLEVQPFGQEQSEKFIHNWYLTHETMRKAGVEDEGVRLKARERAEDLLRRLRGQPAIYELTSNPLLLTMIAAVHSARNAIPGRRVELYAEICNVMLGHWNAAKGLKTPLSGPQLRAVLEPLAARMMEMGQRELSKGEVRNIVEEPLDSVGYPAGEARAEFLPMLEKASGLFLERENDRWSYAHLSFQEYLAAAYYRGQAETLPLDKIVSDPWWHETLRLYAALGDATKLIQACLKTNEVQAFVLMSECLEEGRSIEPTVRTGAEQRLVADLESENPRRRRLAAEVKLAKRLKNLQASKEDIVMDEDCISMAEYQLFVDERKGKGENNQPDHWTTYQFPRGQAKSPVVGVRDEDADAFVSWLNKKQTSAFEYRLPSMEEAKKYPGSARGSIALWCKDTEKDLWLDHVPEEHIQSFQNTLLHLDTEVQNQNPISLPQGRLSDVFRFRARALDLGRALALDLDLALARARALALDLALALDRARALLVDRNRARARTRTFILVRDRDLDRDLDRALDRDLDRALNRALVFALNRLHDRLHDLDLSEVRNVIRVQNFVSARQKVQPLLSSSDIPTRRKAKLLQHLLDLVQTQDDKSYRLAYMRYAARLLEYAWLGSDPALIPNPNDQLSSEEREALRSLHHWCHLIAARIEGTLPAFEGIRIVCERRK